MNTALQAGLNREKLDFMQAVIREISGISAAHSRNASPVQAARCSGVPWAKPAKVDARVQARAALTRSLVMEGSPLALGALDQRGSRGRRSWQDKFLIVPPLPRPLGKAQNSRVRERTCPDHLVI